MSEDNTQTAGSGTTLPKRQPFPAIRLFYALGFAFVAWVVFWLALFLALVQWVVTAVGGAHDDTLKHWSRSLNQYLWEVLSFVLFVRDEKPFPFGPFPSA